MSPAKYALAWVMGALAFLLWPVALVGFFAIGLPILVGQDLLRWWSDRPWKREGTDFGRFV